MQARVIKSIKDHIFIAIDNDVVKSDIKGQLRLNKITPVAGDIVDYEMQHGKPIITKIHERKDYLLRPKVANVDIVAIIQSTKTPDFDTFLLDQMIAYYEQFNCEIIVLLTKSDIYIDDKIKQYVKDYEQMGYKFYDTNNGADYDKLLDLFSNKLICFVGNSGVGKSTFINRLNPELYLRVQDVSNALNRGKHTTTHSEIIKVHDFYIVDTPGYSTITINYSKHRLAQLFFHRVLDGAYCKFNDCFHQHNASQCLIKNLLDSGKVVQWRYDNYLKILEGVKNKYD